MFSTSYRPPKSLFRSISFQYSWFPRCVSGTIPAKHQDLKVSNAVGRRGRLPTAFDTFHPIGRPVLGPEGTRIFGPAAA